MNEYKFIILFFIVVPMILGILSNGEQLSFLNIILSILVTLAAISEVQKNVDSSQ